MKAEASQLLAAAQLAADRAAAFLWAEEGRTDPSEWTEKGRVDLVTAVDREAERLMAETLTQARPTSRLVGEELSPGPLPPGLAWLVEPRQALIGTGFPYRHVDQLPRYQRHHGSIVAGNPAIHRWLLEILRLEPNPPGTP